MVPAPAGMVNRLPPATAAATAHRTRTDLIYRQFRSHSGPRDVAVPIDPSASDSCEALASVASSPFPSNFCA